MSPIELKGLEIRYGSQVVAQDLNLVLDKPEIISIIGPNGSGKSTLLKTMAHLLLPSAGTVYLNGRDMNRFSTDALARMISFMPQSMQAPGDITVRDLVLLGRLPYQGLFSSLGDDDLKAADKALAGTGMTDLQHKRLSALSGGERQRAWLALALAKEPEVLLLDEPTNHLDMSSIAWLETYLLNYPGAVLIVSHDRYLMNKLADRPGRHGLTRSQSCRALQPPADRRQKRPHRRRRTGGRRVLQRHY